MVESEQRVVYEDLTPVAETVVHQWSDNTNYEVFTDEDGKWVLMLPVGSEWELCIENPRDNYGYSCYNGILVVDENGSLNQSKDD